MVHDPYALLSSLDAPSAQSVLAIVASSSHIFAGSQSGFLDVCPTFVLLFFVLLSSLLLASGL